MVEALSEGSSRSQLKTAFVLAGGGSFGAIQVGMLHSLVAHGMTADMVVGSSVGAMNAAYHAGIPTVEGIEQLAKIWRNLRRRDVFPITPLVLSLPKTKSARSDGEVRPADAVAFYG